MFDKIYEPAGVSVIKLRNSESRTFSPYLQILYYGDIKIRFTFHNNTEKMSVLRKYGVLQHWPKLCNNLISVILCMNKVITRVMLSHCLHSKDFFGRIGQNSK